MASLSELQRFLNQQRATGKPFSSRRDRAAFEAFFDAEAGKNIQKGQLALQKRNIDLAQSNADRAFGLQQQQLEQEKKSSTLQGLVQMGGLAKLGAETETGKAAISGVKGLFGGGKTVAGGAGAAGAGGGAQAVTASSLLTPAQASALSNAGISVGGGAGGAGAAGTGTSSTAGGLGTTGTASGIGAIAIADEILQGSPSDISGTERFEQKIRGFGRMGGISGGAANLIEGAVGEEGKEIFDKITDPTGIMRKAEREIGRGVASIMPKVFGGEGKDPGSKFIDSIFGSTWLCTKTKETVGMTEEEWKTIGEFRAYAKENHTNWLEWYVNIGPELIEAIDGNKEYYSGLKEYFLRPIIRLMEEGFPKTAYIMYKKTVIDLVMEFKPELIETAPEVN